MPRIELTYEQGGAYEKERNRHVGVPFVFKEQ